MLEEIQESAFPQTLYDIIQKVDRAFVLLQEKPRTGGLSHEEGAVIELLSDSEDGNNTKEAKLREPTASNDISLSVADAEDEAFSFDCSSDDTTNSPQQPPKPAVTFSRTFGQNDRMRGARRLRSSNFQRDGSAATIDTTLDGTSEDADENREAYYSSIGKPSPIQVRISEDLRNLRQHGYYYGVLAGMSEVSTDNLLAVSLRTSDLGLSPEMLMAWDLDPGVFIVLLIRLRSHYVAYETLINSPRSSVDLDFRIGKCARYKPSLEDALSSFGSTPDPDSAAKSGHVSEASRFGKILVSTSLSRFMNEYFLNLARYREDHNCSWASAVSDIVNRSMNIAAAKASDDRSSISASQNSCQKSFPLLAMQFAMDQLKNCTEYCQACHARLSKSHRSLKPTVCSRDLCLYQHISLGMGRSVEYEILCQPNVVDLLINFCYAALEASIGGVTCPIRSYPSNSPLRIPDWCNPLKGIYSNKVHYRPSFVVSTPSYGDSRASISQFSPGQWVVIYVGTLASNPSTHTLTGAYQPPGTKKQKLHLDGADIRHAVVTSVNSANSTVYLQHFDTQYSTVNYSSAEIFFYTKDFDDVLPDQKAANLLLVLNTLPPVQHLKVELEKPSVNDLKPASGVSPAAAVLLGWIMATNRSCILQINEPALMIHERFNTTYAAPQASYLQFCFLQGVPEADHEFQKQLEINTSPGSRHPTLLAWHGSNIANWHSILRTGLDYENTANGRAFGNGVYFSPLFTTSLQYATGLNKQWPKAVFDLRSIVSLNEVINAPQKFRSSTPHYVIKQRYWSRCRFLFAKQANMEDSGQSAQLMVAQPMLPAQSSMQIHAQSQALQTQLGQQNQWAHQNKTMPIVSIGGQQMHATLPSLLVPAPQPQYVGMPVQQTPRCQQTSATASQRAVALENSGPDRVFVQDPERPALGPGGGYIDVPLVLMPETPSIGGDEEHRGKRSRVSFDQGSEVMDASDLAFLSTDTSTSKKAIREPHLGSAVENAITIDSDPDLDADSGKTLASFVAMPLRPRRAPGSSLLPPSKPSARAQADRALADRALADALGLTPFEPGTLDYASLPQLPVPSWCTSHAQRALARDIDRMQKVQTSTPLPELGWYINFAHLDNMFQWIVELHSFDVILPLAQDMLALGVSSIVCELRFGADYPMSPPLVRVIRPRFLPFLQGGGGNVTAGGAMCMELLTSTGWTPANQTDAVLLQVRLALSATDRPARLDSMHLRSDYGVGEAFDAYNRAAATHGWQVPADMQKRMNF